MWKQRGVEDVEASASDRKADHHRHLRLFQYIVLMSALAAHRLQTARDCGIDDEPAFDGCQICASDPILSQ